MEGKVATVVSKELVLQANGRFFDWIKGFQKAAGAQGFLGLFDLAGAVRIHRPKEPTEIADRMAAGRVLNDKEIAAWNLYSHQVQEYEQKCGRALSLIESYVAEEVFDKIQTQVPDWDLPSHVKLQEVLQFIKRGHGGIYDAHRDAENMLAINSIPFFTDHLSAVKYINKLKLYLKEREMWENGRTTAQKLVGTSFLISEALLNNWLSQRLIGSESRMTALRDAIDEVNTPFHKNAEKVIRMFEKLERDKRREDVMKAKHGGESQPAWSMSFGAQVGASRTDTVGGKKRMRDDHVCFICKEQGHRSFECPTKIEEGCLKCGKKGHLASTRLQTGC